MTSAKILIILGIVLSICVVAYAGDFNVTSGGTADWNVTSGGGGDINFTATVGAENVIFAAENVIYAGEQVVYP